MPTIGILSDTHGLMRPEALAALAGVDHILHAGDVGSPAILPALQAIAPVTAIAGNIDTGTWARMLPATLRLDLFGISVCMVHKRGDLPGNAALSGIQLAIFGHSHKPLLERVGETALLNPGSAGPRRFRLPVTLAHVRVEHAAIADITIETLPIPA
ncbi:metallophosphoesterase family protein [Aureimonas frigidaquae]|uniref:metallophosphoesterase family protein n=1 Tax=Aureimonas frigidaquae TaxID=424757 RepID=UPI000785AAB2|nr:metallophosphoesterase family protein [Aureimonas frigidaquae]